MHLLVICQCGYEPERGKISQILLTEKMYHLLICLAQLRQRNAVLSAGSQVLAEDLSLHSFATIWAHFPESTEEFGGLSCPPLSCSSCHFSIFVPEAQSVSCPWLPWDHSRMQDPVPTALPTRPLLLLLVFLLKEGECHITKDWAFMW